MHELSLASDILRATARRLADRDGAIPRRLRVRVGALSGVSAESLRFCLEAGRGGEGLEALERVEVEVSTVMPSLVCPVCGEVPCGARFEAACPECGGRVSGTTGGDGLEVELDCEEPQAWSA
jgi:Zn finger protein HypA/HybF involved in hydrogenase expression